MKRVNLHYLNQKEQENTLNEVRILASLKHPNLIEYKEVFVDES